LLTPVPVGYDLAKLFLTFVIAGREFGAEQLEIGWRTYAVELPESFRASLSRQSTLIPVEMHWLLTRRTPRRTATEAGRRDLRASSY
jgi:hypothetical protein